MSTDHLSLWRQVEQTDPHFTKAFSRGGGFRGTATNATYLVRRATEVFGPVGIGWGYDIVEEDMLIGAPLDERGTHELIHRIRLKLWYRLGEQTGGVTHFGQTTFVGRNKNGFFTDEEAPKKSLTDALSKCLSMLGFAADVHLGRYDDNKYVAEVTRLFKPTPSLDFSSLGKDRKEDSQATQEERPLPIGPAGRAQIEAQVAAAGLDLERVIQWVRRTFGTVEIERLTPDQRARLEHKIEDQLKSHGAA